MFNLLTARDVKSLRLSRSMVYEGLGLAEDLQNSRKTEATRSQKAPPVTDLTRC